MKSDIYRTIKDLRVTDLASATQTSAVLCCPIKGMCAKTSAGTLGANRSVMGGARRDSANTPVRSCARWFATVAICGASFISAGAAEAVEAGDSQILYFERLNVAAPTTAASEQKSSRSRDLQFDAYGRRFVLSLQPNDKLSPLLQSKSGTTPVDLYQGQIEGASQSWVRIGVADGELHGMLWDGADCTSSSRSPTCAIRCPRTLPLTPMAPPSSGSPT